MTSPGAGQFTQYPTGPDQVLTMSPRRDVAPPSAFNVYTAELPKEEQERLKKLNAPHAASVRALPRFECAYVKDCKYAFASEAAKLEHEKTCLETLRLGREQHKKDGDGQGVTREEVVGIVKDALSELVRELRGEGKPKGKKKQRGRPRHARSDAHPGEAEAVRPSPDAEVGPDAGEVEGPAPEPGQAAD